MRLRDFVAQVELGATYLPSSQLNPANRPTDVRAYLRRHPPLFSLTLARLGTEKRKDDYGAHGRRIAGWARP